jgi:hypothetical protein
MYFGYPTAELAYFCVNTMLGCYLLQIIAIVLVMILFPDVYNNSSLMFLLILGSILLLVTCNQRYLLSRLARQHEENWKEGAAGGNMMRYDMSSNSFHNRQAAEMSSIRGQGKGKERKTGSVALGDAMFEFNASEVDDAEDIPLNPNLLDDDFDEYNDERLSTGIVSLERFDIRELNRNGLPSAIPHRASGEGVDLIGLDDFNVEWNKSDKDEMSAVSASPVQQTRKTRDGKGLSSMLSGMKMFGKDKNRDKGILMADDEDDLW